MDRRQVLKSMGVAALAQLSSTELFALASETHAQLQDIGEADRHIFKSLDPLQNETVIVVSELILPETDTPGAKAAKVNEFVDVMLTDWFNEAERSSFIRGLAGLDSDEQRFVDMDEAAQVAALSAAEAQALDMQRDRNATGGPLADSESPADQPFFSVMKWLTLYGYFTSRVGMEQELAHEIFPGSYDGCAPVRKVEV
jgi:hypothetical protein